MPGLPGARESISEGQKQILRLPSAALWVAQNDSPSRGAYKRVLSFRAAWERKSTLEQQQITVGRSPSVIAFSVDFSSLPRQPMRKCPGARGESRNVRNPSLRG